MSQATKNQANTANKKPYHSPQLQKFGKVSELTLTNTISSMTSDGGSGGARYAS